jgi:hypothetical protein
MIFDNLTLARALISMALVSASAFLWVTGFLAPNVYRSIGTLRPNVP